MVNFRYGQRNDNCLNDCGFSMKLLCRPPVGWGRHIVLQMSSSSSASASHQLLLGTRAHIFWGRHVFGFPIALTFDFLTFALNVNP